MIKKNILSLLLFCCFTHLYAQLVNTSDLSIHDPVLMEENGIYYLFSTGRGISVWSSIDMQKWKAEKPIFNSGPQWAIDTIPSFKNHIWAPDIYYHKGQYHLYYSVSTFGKNTSAIGVATNTTLNPNSPDFRWIDHGRVIQSYPNKTNWNAIDPNIIDDAEGNPYMLFGSFWDGIQLISLNDDRLSIRGEAKTVASRKMNPRRDPNYIDAGENAIEAPFVFKKGKYFYLFVSIDYCCKGVNSTYKMIVGRSKSVTGPYIDEQGRDMAEAGGKLVLKGNEQWHGVGHNAVVNINKQDYMLFHGYDAYDNGISKLRIKKITWDRKGWPTVVPDSN